MSKKIILIAILSLALAMMAFKAFNAFTEQQMEIVAEGIVQRFIWSYTEDSCYEYGTTNTCPTLLPDSLIKSRLNLCNILGSVPDAVVPKMEKTDRKMTEEITEWHFMRMQDSIYADWVPWALRNRDLFIPLWTKSKAVQFWSMVDNAAVAKKLDFKARQRLFSEIGKAVLYYKQSLTKLITATPAERKQIFDLAATVSPRYRAYELQEQLWEKQTTNLTVANQKLRANLASIGVVVSPNCHDFYDYQFTRYDRTYDYLFAICRWAARHDDGTFGESEISGYKTATLDAFVKEAKELAETTYTSLYSYTVKQ